VLASALSQHQIKKKIFFVLHNHPSADGDAVNAKRSVWVLSLQKVPRNLPDGARTDVLNNVFIHSAKSSLKP
jgi:hypothetical protein